MSEELVLASPEVTAFRGDMVYDWEQHESSTGLSGVIVHFGVPYTYEEMSELTAKAFPGKEVPGHMGFDVLYRCPEAIDGNALEYEIASVLLRQVLEQKGWSADQVDVLMIGNSSPPNMNFAWQVAQENGLFNVSVAQTCALACNSGGYALFEGLKYEGKRVVVLAIENMTKFVTGVYPDKADPFSTMCFSSGAAACAFTAGEKIVLDAWLDGVVDLSGLPVGTTVDNGTVLVQDVNGALAARTGYTCIQEQRPDAPYGIWRFEQQGFVMTPMPIPPDKGPNQINMRVGDTGRLMLKVIPPILSQVIERAGGAGSIQHADIHNASINIVRGQGRFLQKKHHIDIEFPWRNYQGNTVAAATLTAWIRSLSEVKAGEKALIASFGAGVSITPFTVVYT